MCARAVDVLPVDGFDFFFSAPLLRLLLNIWSSSPFFFACFGACANEIETDVS